MCCHNVVSGSCFACRCQNEKLEIKWAANVLYMLQDVTYTYNKVYT